MGPQNLESLKYWANDEHGFMTGLFYSTKILLKTWPRVSLHKTSIMSLIFMNMSLETVQLTFEVSKGSNFLISELEKDIEVISEHHCEIMKISNELQS